MLKALLKKQLLEINQFYFVNRKTGKRNKPFSVILKILLFTVLFAVIAYNLYEVACLVGDVVLVSHTGVDWIYFSFMGTMAFLFGTIGSAFQTYSALYKARDNDLLLSMPIPSGMILLARGLGVVAVSALYSGIVWVPAIAGYAVLKPGASLLWPILMLPMIGLFVSVFTCAMGALIAFLSVKFKGKSLFRVFVSVLFFAVYYVLIARIQSIISGLLLRMNDMAAVFQSWLYPLYLLGRGSAGEFLYVLLFTGLTLILLAVCGWILSHSFTRVVTSVPSGHRKKRGKKDVFRGRRGGLFVREWKRFVSSSAYMLNTGIGVIILIGLSVFALIKSRDLQMLLGMLSLIPDLPFKISSFYPIGIFCFVALFAAMCNITAPSISLEGNTLWLVRSMPVKAIEVLNAKKYLHIAVLMPAILLSVVMLGIAFGLSWPVIMLLIAMEGLLIWFMADLGLMLNLKMPNFHWTSEITPIKQSMPVALCLFGGWAIAIAVGTLAVVGRNVFQGLHYLYVVGSAEILGVALMEVLLRKRGTLLFEAL